MYTLRGLQLSLASAARCTGTGIMARFNGEFLSAIASGGCFRFTVVCLQVIPDGLWLVLKIAARFRREVEEALWLKW